MLSFRPPRFHTLPEIRSGAPLPHFVGVIIPEETTNLVTNPSIETATTNYTAVGGSIARSATKQYHGTYSLAITPTAATTDGAYYGTISLTSGTTYTLSCKFWGLPGVKYKISFATTGGVDLAVKPFIGTGRWQWLWVTYTETSTTTRRLYFAKNTHTSTGVFYVDGVQVEAKAYPTTYCDGDQLGLLVGQQPPAYLWTGTVHASTSTRSALTRAGGKVVNIRTAYGFLLTGIIGLGMATPNNVSIPYTVLDGARYQRTTKPPRTFSLTGRFQATTTAHLDRLTSDMRQAFDRDLVPLQQPLVLLTEPRDECDNPTGDFAQVQCIYAGGLEGNDTSALAEDAAPTFTTYLPYLSGGDGGASLTVQTSVSNANAILKRSPSGTWSALGTGVGSGVVLAMVIGSDGSLYACGTFPSMGGVANTAYIARWDGSAWNALSTGGNDFVNDMAFDPSGNLYAIGKFTLMGGIANTVRIAKWSGSAWTALGTGMSGGGVGAQDRAVVVDNLGNVYAGGEFTDAGGSGADFVAKWNGSAWSALGSVTAINNTVFALVVDPSNNVYAGGNFTDASGVASADRVAKWNGTAWSALSTGMDSTVSALERLSNGMIVAGGAFTTAGGVSAPNIAQWNGTGWATMGTLNGNVTRLFAGQNGLLYTSGDFTTANSITLPDRAAVWNGSTWLPIDVDVTGSSSMSAAVTAPDGTLYLAFKTSGTATTAAVTAVTNDTPGFVWPRLVINGPSSGTSRIYQIVNYTTNVGVYLNLTLSAGEVATLDFNPQAPSFTTTFQGDITNTILPGSQPALLYLAPGSNSISFFAASSTVTATLSWQKRYNGVADLVN